jgi:hypothetical protein
VFSTTSNILDAIFWDGTSTAGELVDLLRLCAVHYSRLSILSTVLNPLRNDIESYRVESIIDLIITIGNLASLTLTGYNLPPLNDNIALRLLNAFQVIRQKRGYVSGLRLPVGVSPTSRQYKYVVGLNHLCLRRIQHRLCMLRTYYH